MTDPTPARDAAFDGFGIVGNEPVFRELVELLNTDEAIAFVGAGASAPLYPLWDALVAQLAELAVTQRRAKPRQQQYWCRKAKERPDRIAQQIRGVLLPGGFADFMRTTFGVRKGADGLPFTPTHAALARLPFQGHVTTNYDHGLEEACSALRRDRKPKSFRWDDETVSLWRRETPQDPRELPIFHAHGDVDRVDSMVLGIDDYRRVYTDQHPYLDLLGHLMSRERLVFVGFGFSDPWLVSFADRVATVSGGRQRTAPRHIAIVGLPEDEIEDADLHARELEESLHARVLFYPVRQGSHAALGELLDALLRWQATPGDAAASVPVPSPPQTDLLDRWFDHVIDTHRRLVDCFDRPGSLSLIEEAWVELQVRPDGLMDEDPSIKGHELMGRKLALAEVIGLDATSAPWITGRWLLEGSPGSGKTTLLRHYARTLATSRNRSRIPLFVSLARVVGHDRGLPGSARAGDRRRPRRRRAAGPPRRAARRTRRGAARAPLDGHGPQKLPRAPLASMPGGAQHPPAGTG